MEKSVPIFEKILEVNQLINGRLNISISDLEKIYNSLYNDDKYLRKKQSQEKKKNVV